MLKSPKNKRKHVLRESIDRVFETLVKVLDNADIHHHGINSVLFRGYLSAIHWIAMSSLVVQPLDNQSLLRMKQDKQRSRHMQMKWLTKRRLIFLQYFMLASTTCSIPPFPATTTVLPDERSRSVSQTFQWQADWLKELGVDVLDLACRCAK